MTQECKVAVIPLAPFFQSHSNSHKLVRFAFCKDDEILSQAEVNLKTFLQSNLSSQQRGNNHAQATLAT